MSKHQKKYDVFISYRRDGGAEDGVHPVKIFRIHDAAYELTESVIDTSLGRIGVIGLNDGD